MPRQSAVTVENNFKNGLITEASGLNFPESACTETYNCEFALDGSVRRRLGFDFEDAYQTKTINRANNVVSSYLWKNVAGDGDLTLLVKQVGNTLYFYELSDSSFSLGAVATTVTLTPVAGAVDVETVEASFSDGNGYLIVTHPYCEPMLVSYNKTTQTASADDIIVKIRDFEGAIADPYSVDTRPTSTLAALDESHEYNLRNQGWNTTNLTAWDTAQTTMPSNSDVMWRFQDSSGNFDASSAAIARVVTGNTPAPKGHFILDLADQDRDTAAGTTGVASTTTGSVRPHVSAFFAGRVFYSGIRYAGYNSDIYFTQIIENDSQYGNCFQVNDPTAEDLFDLLPSDGGSVTIPEAGTIYNLVTVPGGLTVFAENGIWFITGSSGIGFTATDYTVQLIARIPTLSFTSFVNVAGYPSWWNAEGIYIMVSQQGQSAASPQGLPSVQSLTDQTIKSFYADIPLSSKRYARGVYHYIDRHIRWIYRSEATDDITERYEFDRVLNFNVQTGAFYPWTISDSDVKVNGIVVSDVISGSISVDNVVDGADDVVDDLGNQVITFTNSGTETSPFDKYIVSYADSGSYEFTFADKINSSYIDWFQYDLEGVNYVSYFITGYKVRGQGMRKFQSNYVRVFSRLLSDVAYYFQGMWDYATSGNTGRWSVSQRISHPQQDFSNISRRLKVRGHGLVLQFKVTSADGESFDIIGWSTLESGNQTP